MFNPPTLEDLQETRRANEKLVLEALDSKPEWVETELAKTTGLALSHLRAALASLLDQGRVRRLPGTGTRAVYGLADPGLADVPATPLTEDALRIREYLEGRADSAFYMSNELRLSREEIMAALSLLNAHNMITCTFVGSLVIFRLKEQQALDAEAVAAAETAEAAEQAETVRNSAAKTRKAKAQAGASGAELEVSADDSIAEPAKKTAAKSAAKAPKKSAAKKTAAKAITGETTTDEAATDDVTESAPAPAKKPAAEKAPKKAAAPKAKPAAKAKADASKAKADADAPAEPGAQKPVRKRVSKPLA